MKLIFLTNKFTNFEAVLKVYSKPFNAFIRIFIYSKVQPKGYQVFQKIDSFFFNIHL